ncbi:porin family protein [Kaistella palustris]|uniref:porin family protein n=1 Tax=Kaistella palustris TaxID=493376 RepID=UPI0003FFE3A2|nr:porin family protein [Kaistella palustris]
MKKLLLTGAVALCGLVNAQNVNFGANAGMLTGFASLKTPMGNDSDNSTGFYAGFFAEINAGNKFKIQPAVNYANIENASALQIPVMVKYYAAPKFNLQFGPQFTFDLEDNPLPEAYNSTNFGIALGAAYEFTEKLFVEGRYSFQVNNHLKNAPSDYTLRANYLNLGLGYKF